MANYGILLVDDEVGYHAIVPALLRPMGCRVDCVTSGAAAIEAVQRSRFSLILMNIELGSGEDGYRSIASLRASADWLGLCPAIAFTTFSPPEGEAYFQRRGFDGWLHKPFTGADIANMAQRWLGRAPPPSEGDGRLATLLGAEQAAQMIDRLYVSLGEAVAAIDAGAAAAGFGHRLGGLAGTLGFPMLSAIWLGLQDGDTTCWPTVRALTCEAIAQR